MNHQIRRANAALAEAVRRGDAAAIASLYAADARLLVPGGQLLAGRGEIEAYWQAGIALGVSNLELKSRAVELVGAVAIEIGIYAVTLRADRPGPIVERGIYVVIHAFESGISCQRAAEIISAHAS